MKHFNKVMAIMIMAVFSNTVSAAQVNTYHGGDNRLLESTTNYKEGRQYGLQTKWHKNGTKASTGNYNNGFPDGIQTSWYDDGTIKSVINYNKNGDKHGLETRWYRVKRKYHGGNNSLIESTDRLKKPISRLKKEISRVNSLVQ